MSDRVAAKVANGLLMDLGLVKKGRTKMLMCPAKVRRERQKWGRNLEKERKNMQLPGGFYTDGKKCPTLVRDAVKMKVRMPGRRGKGSYKIVTTVSNKIEIQDHYPVISEPGGPSYT